MDFTFDETQQEIRDLARRILEDKVTVDLLRRVDAGGDRFDQGTWDALGAAGLLGVGLPEDVGGGGLGIVEQCLVLEQVGRTVAPVPVLAHCLLGAGPVGRWGSAAAKARWAAPAADGSIVLTGALEEPGNCDPLRPATTATPHAEGGWRLDGVKTTVPAVGQAAAVVVPATIVGGASDGAVALFVVAVDAPGLVIEHQQMTDGAVHGRLTLAGVAVGDDDRLGEGADGIDLLRSVVEHATVAQCAQQLGVVARALEITADYTKQRIQFERPIATFQAVGQRAADAYIDVEAVRLTLWQAMWRLAAGLPASLEVEVAKFWAADAGHRIAHTAVHLHGGTGVDLDYPVHRYFVAAKAIEFALGGATAQLLRIGRTFAESRE